MSKRLFIFAAYDADGIVREDLLYYLNALSKLGDIVFFMDNNVSPWWLDQIRAVPNVLHAAAERHGEYDFGSYRRGYEYAAAKGLLEKYDWIWFVNDSVLGPLSDIGPMLNDLESRGAAAAGPVVFNDGYYESYVQSWFFGLPRQSASHLGDFMNSVRRQDGKRAIVQQYEMPMSWWLAKHADGGLACRWPGADIYKPHIQPADFPFIKKLGLKWTTGKWTPESLGAKIADADLRRIVIEWCHRNHAAFKQYKYEKFRRIQFLGIPILTILQRCNGNRHKAMLFGIIPLFGWSV